MLSKTVLFAGLIAAVAVLAGPAFAQLAPAPPDPLAGMRAAAAGNAQVCTNSEASACAQANPKILAAAMGSPVLAENLHALAANDAGAPDLDTALTWAVRAFRSAGADVVSAEAGYADPTIAAGQKNVIAEIRGREKPDEFVVLSANLEDSCNAALLVEAARDIHLTGLRPLRSIRFILFGGKSLGAWAYVRKHRSELDRAAAAVSIEYGCSQVKGFALSGREELVPGIREALNFAPVEAWGIDENAPNVLSSNDAFDFLLEGIPALWAVRSAGPPSPQSETDLDILKKNATIAGVLAFGLAEHATPLGSRLSRMEIETLLRRSGLDSEMQKTGVWPLWQSGQRGRQP